MAHYTFRFLNPTGGVIRMAFAERDTDGEAVRTALADAREPYALLEVWRGVLVYRGTGAEYALHAKGRHMPNGASCIKSPSYPSD